MEEFLLRGFLALEEMDVVDEEQVGLAEPATELARRPILNRLTYSFVNCSVPR